MGRWGDTLAYTGAPSSGMCPYQTLILGIVIEPFVFVVEVLNAKKWKDSDYGKRDGFVYSMGWGTCNWEISSIFFWHQKLVQMEIRDRVSD